MVSGTQADLAIKIFGPDLSALFRKGTEIKELLKAFPQVVDVNVEQQVETPQLQIRADRERLAFYGITMAEFNAFVEAAFPGKRVGSVYEEERSFDLIIRLNKDYTESMEGVRRALIDTPDGKVALDDIAVAKGIDFSDLLDEVEAIVYSGTKLNIDYFLDEVMDEEHLEDIYEYFKESTTDDLDEAIDELGDDYTEDEIRLVRIKFISEMAN
jgi:hypothetical protein